MNQPEEPPDPPGTVSDQNGEEAEGEHEDAEFSVRRARPDEDEHKDDDS